MERGGAYQDLGDEGIRAVLDALPDLVAVVDHAGAVRWINERGLQLCGIDPGDASRLTIWDVLDPEDYDMAILGMSLSVADDHRPPGLLDLVLPDGSRKRIEVFSRTVKLDGAECVLIIGRPTDHRIEEQIDGLIQGEPFEQVVQQAMGGDEFAVLALSIGSHACGRRGTTDRGGDGRSLRGDTRNHGVHRRQRRGGCRL